MNNDYDPSELDVRNVRNWNRPVQKAKMWQMFFHIEFADPLNLNDVAVLETFLQSGMRFVQHKYISESKYLKDNSEEKLLTFPLLQVSCEVLSESRLKVSILSDEHPINFYFFPCYDFLFTICQTYIGPISQIQEQEVHIWEKMMDWP